MTKGIIAAERVKYEILQLAADGKEHPTSYYVKNINVAKNTVMKYLRELWVKDHFITLSLPKNESRPVYKITQRGIAEAQRLKSRSQIDKELDKLNAEHLREYAMWILKLMRTCPDGSMLLKMSDEDGSRNFTLIPPSQKLLKAFIKQLQEDKDERMAQAVKDFLARIESRR